MPKPRPIGVGDGQQAKYSCTMFWCLSEGVTQEGRSTWCMDAKITTKRDSIGKSVESLTLKCYVRINS